MPKHPEKDPTADSANNEQEIAENSNETTKKTRNPQKKLSPYDKAALTLKSHDPLLTPHKIGHALLKAGISKNPNTIYKRLRKSSYLREEFKVLENSLREQLVREDYPDARKALRKHLINKDNTTPAAVQVQAAKIVYDKVLGDKQDRSFEAPVNIENIERIQVLIQQAVED